MSDSLADEIAAEEQRVRLFAGLALWMADEGATDEQVLKLAMMAMMGRGNPGAVLAQIRKLRTALLAIRRTESTPNERKRKGAVRK